MNRLLPLGVSAAILVGGCSSNPQEAEPQSPTPQECVEEYYELDNVESNIESAESRIQSALDLADTINSPEVASVAEFIRSNMTTSAVSDQKVEILLLRSNETYDCEFLSYVSTAPAFGFYNLEGDVLALIEKPNEPVSDLWGGLLTLHEAKHAQSRSQNADSPLEERNTRIFEQIIIEQIGGAQYQEYLTDFKAQIVESGFNQTDGWVLESESITKLLDNTRLDTIFGPTLSDNDQRIRGTAVTMHAIFDLIADTAPSQGFDVAQTQQSTMEQFQGQSGFVAPN